MLPSQPNPRARALAARRPLGKNDENFASHAAPNVTHVKDVNSVIQQQKARLLPNAAPLQQKKRIQALTERTHVPQENENVVGRPIARYPSGTVVKKQPVQAPVQNANRKVLGEKVIATKNHLRQGPVVKQEVKVDNKPRAPSFLDCEPIAFVPPKTHIKEMIPIVTTKRTLAVAEHVQVELNRELKGEDDAIKYEEELAKKRPKREAEANWDDLDADDGHDPLMVSEYVNDIFDYMGELEMSTMPNPRYMDGQKELAWKMRGLLVDWLDEVHHKFRLLPETLFLAVNLIDRFLSLRVVMLPKLQLVGITAMFIASKYEEVMAPSVHNYIFMCDGSYSDQEILQAEGYMLKAIGFSLCYPSPMNFLRRASKADHYNIHSRTIAKYLIEIPIHDHRFLNCPPSLTSAAALCLARRMIGILDWNANMARYSGYEVGQLEACIELMIHFLYKCKSDTFFFRKFSTKRYMHASVFVRQWLVKQIEQARIEAKEIEAAEAEAHLQESGY